MKKTARTEGQATDMEAMAAVRTLLSYIGEDVHREGLLNTPSRVVKAWDEMCSGYGQDPATILATDFDGHGYNEIVACPWIEFSSTCEHHMISFTGHAHVAYIPRKRVVGLSKLGRLVDCFAKRLQIQEQMTKQIADSIESVLAPQGVAVVLQAKHLCMACRGVQKRSSVMVTSAMRGAFMKQGAARAEFFKLVELAAHSNGRGA